MLKRPKPRRCTYAATCSMLKRLSMLGQWHSWLNCQCSLHEGGELTIYLFDKRITANPIYRAYKKGEEPKNLKLGLHGYYFMSDLNNATHMLIGETLGTYCGLPPIPLNNSGYKKTTIINKVSCPVCYNAAPKRLWRNIRTGTIYSHVTMPRYGMVTVYPLGKLSASPALADNVELVEYSRPVNPHRAGKTTETLRAIYTECASDVADEFYPKGHPRRGEFLRDQAVLFVKLQPLLLELIKNQSGVTKEQIRDLMSTHKIIEDVQ